MMHFEDVELDVPHRFGRYEVTREEVVEFASRYDPQPFHLDDEAAAATHFGRLSASGWHTCAMTMRMLVDDMRERGVASLGSPGIDELRWRRPVFPGDTLGCESVTLSKRRSRSRPEIGLTRGRIRVLNQDGETVLEMLANSMIAVRDPSAPIEEPAP